MVLVSLSGLHRRKEEEHRAEIVFVSVTISLPRIRLSGCACRSPLAHFFIHHAASSIRELHPFTTITHLASQDSNTESSDPDLLIQFLFRTRDTLRPKTDALSKENILAPYLPQYFLNKFKHEKSIPWTTKLASLADEKERTDNLIAREKLSQAEPAHIDLSLRLEGPYFTLAEPYHYDLNICLVAGTGISGALAIGAAFNKHAVGDISTQPRQWTRCCIIWSVKADEEIDLPFLEPLAEGLEVRKFVTGRKRSEGDEKVPQGQRADLDKEMVGLVCPIGAAGPRTWVYISGPKPFIASAKTACRNMQKAGARLDVQDAGWDP